MGQEDQGEKPVAWLTGGTHSFLVAFVVGAMLDSFWKVGMVRMFPGLAGSPACNAKANGLCELLSTVGLACPPYQDVRPEVGRVSLRTGIHTCTHTHTYPYAYTCTHKYMHTHHHVHAHTYMHSYADAHTHIHCTSIHAYTNMHAPMYTLIYHTQLYAHSYIHIGHAHAHTTYTHEHIRTDTYTYIHTCTTLTYITCVHTYRHIHTYLYMHKHACALRHTCTHTDTAASLLPIKLCMTSFQATGGRDSALCWVTGRTVLKQGETHCQPSARKI